MTASTKVLWIPHTSWSVPQRARLYAPRLVEAGHQVHATDWDAQFRTVRDFLSRRYLRNFLPWEYDSAGVHVHHIPRISPALFVTPIRRFNTMAYAHAVDRIVRDCQIEAVVGTFVAPPPRADRLIFDLFDDNVALWKDHGRNPAYADEIATTEQAYLERADVIVAASEVLRDRVATRIRRDVPIHVIPNGVDLDHFQASSGERIRSELGLSPPVVGVVGNHDRPGELRLVIDALIAVDPTISLLIVGEGVSIRESLAYAHEGGLRRVVSVGRVAHDRIPDYMAALDIGLCPYRNSSGDDARSPMKLVEYLAAGARVVCTDLESVRRWDLPNVTLVDGDSQSFAAGIRQSLTMTPMPIGDRLAPFDLDGLTRRFSEIISGGNSS